MKIVQVAPDIYPVPPKDYGGIERVVYDVSEGLVKRGHEVYLYAKKNSTTNAKFIPYQHIGQGDFSSIADYVLRTIPEDVDIIHDHTHISILGKKELVIPTICTIHGTINYRVKHPVFVSKRALEVIGGGHGHYVYNGINLEEFEYSNKKDEYMLYLGRLDKHKGLNYALEVAVRTKKRLIIAGPVHDMAYYETDVSPVLSKYPFIEYIGSVGGAKKQEVLKRARCLLFPTSWEEPFGLVMVEAMACGTPVIAFGNGAVPEVLKEFPDCICSNIDEMVTKVCKEEYPDSSRLRKYVSDNFTIDKMVNGYLEVYEAVAKKSHKSIFISFARPLKIVQVAPDAFPCPPKDYGGIERVVHDLTEELVCAGHDVYMFAADGSISSANLITYEHKGNDPKKMAEFVMKNLPEDVDIIHDHTHMSVMSSCNLKVPIVSTIHDSRKNLAHNPVYLCKKALQNVGLDNGFYTYNGINLDDYEFSERKEDYMLFMGLLYSHKGINYALDVAEKTNNNLIIAGPVYNLDYYKSEIEPRIKIRNNIKYVGAIGGKNKQKILKYARCMLFPTIWEEPFGLVMIEAMACGTPVLAFGNGAVPEVLAGFPELICTDLDEMVYKARIQNFPEAKILRNYVRNNFSARNMSDSYISIYRKAIVRSMIMH